mmetsp:Transcript_28636/g.80651  ORF Transcript_28636/g.80651 Transcript_28636/m.80651 type:complete len:183 (+) Transcript_28636:443-991(+)|eukprot:CAMPEP_0117682374 /NCGR_PEP_ID=MMETSP0804-20121206/19614_1 /TAXON_ID=1074897 /ORGANISM="Tetraselmis astigmatica, Strain CCMP880" /LENGTH=182 /DNA_ID=CAMNT_0005492459 /DNA_START=391 /DNA_END=939 /DNA_ORIENTATION=+
MGGGRESSSSGSSGSERGAAATSSDEDSRAHGGRRADPACLDTEGKRDSHLGNPSEGSKPASTVAVPLDSEDDKPGTSSRKRSKHIKSEKSSKKRKKDSSSKDRGSSKSSKRKDKDKDRHKSKSSDEKKSKSKSKKRDREDDGTKYSVLSGKKIKLKVHKSKDDKLREKTREHMLEMLNSRF